MKIAIINDTHFGARADSQVFTDYFFKFFEEQFFPYLKENDIKTVFHLGYLMDRIKFVNFNTLNNTRKRFLEPLENMGVKTHVILGNHDTYYKNTNDLSEKIIKTVSDEKYRKKIAKKGKEKYMKYFNSDLVSKYIIDKTLNLKNGKKYLWEN